MERQSASAGTLSVRHSPTHTPSARPGQSRQPHRPGPAKSERPRACDAPKARALTRRSSGPVPRKRPSGAAPPYQPARPSPDVLHAMITRREIPGRLRRRMPGDRLNQGKHRPSGHLPARHPRLTVPRWAMPRSAQGRRKPASTLVRGCETPCSASDPDIHARSSGATLTRMPSRSVRRPAPFLRAAQDHGCGWGLAAWYASWWPGGRRTTPPSHQEQGSQSIVSHRRAYQ